MAASLRRLFAIDVRSLAALRIALGAILLVDLGQRARYLDVNYADAGVLPRATLGPAWSLHALGGSVAFEAVLFALAAVAAAMLLVGWRTQLATVVSWLLLVSLHNRSWPLQDGGDVLLAMLVFWCMFLPLGACWSADAGRGRAPAEVNDVCSMATVALLLQFVFLYALGGLMKTGADWRTDGTAVARSLEQTFWSLPAGQALLGYPRLLRIVSLGVPWFEIAGSVAMFVPVWTAPIRMLTIVAFALFQLGLGVSIQLNIFPWVSTAATLPFLPAVFWDRVTGTRAAGRTLSLPGGWICEAVVAVVLCYCIAANVSALGFFPLPDRLREVAHAAGVIQGWTMYAPHSAQIDLRFQLVAERDGNGVDLVADGPPKFRALHATRRFKYFLESMLRGNEQTRLRRSYLDWACRVWAPVGRTYLFVAMRQLPDGPWRRTLLLREDCRTGSS